LPIDATPTDNETQAGPGSLQPIAISPASGSRDRLDYVDGLRALAALLVVAGHAYFQPQNGYYSSRILTKLGLTYGHLAVVVFIVVSGFCLGLPAARRGDSLGSLKTFFFRRARRILPPYYAALVLSILFIVFVAHQKTGTVWDNSLPLTRERMLSHWLLIHNLPDAWQNAVAGLFHLNDLPAGETHGFINYPLWSIAVECQLYLLMPLIVWSLAKAGSMATLIWAVSVGLLLHILPNGFLDSATPWYLGQFVLGIVAARECVRRQGRIPALWRTGCYALFILVALVLLLKGKAFFDAYEPYIDTVVAAATALLLAVTLSDNNSRAHLPTRLLSWRPLVTIGIFSYSLYLVHAPLLHAVDLVLVRFVTPKPEARFALLLCAIPIIVGAAYLFHLAFERPFLNMRSDGRVATTASDVNAP
jgi:peptidoglycan/LPS O-acetylase OafA/YrhL